MEQKQGTVEYVEDSIKHGVKDAHIAFEKIITDLHEDLDYCKKAIVTLNNQLNIMVTNMSNNNIQNNTNIQILLYLIIKMRNEMKRRLP